MAEPEAVQLLARIWLFNLCYKLEFAYLQVRVYMYLPVP